MVYYTLEYAVKGTSGNYAVIHPGIGSTTMRLPSLKFLKTFQVAAKLQSFKAAAEELFVTPSAVSHQIKALEEQLGVALFERGVRTLDA
jgi:DNA-binding transcriptional ArsR family regulator